MTDKTNARKAVLLSAFALIAIAAYRDRQGGGVNLFKRVWGVGVLSMFLSVLADFAPGVAGPFAVLTVLGSLTNGGDQALQNLLGGVSGSTGAAPAGTSKAASGKGGATVGGGQPATSSGGGSGGAW